MSYLNVALLQIAPAGSLAGNLEKGTAACKSAKSMGADIALFPEMWSNGYNIYDRPAEEWQAEAIPADSDFIKHIRQTAKRASYGNRNTYLEKCETGPKFNCPV